MLRSRQQELEQRAELRTLEPQPLGLLMLVPKALMQDGGIG